MLKDDVVQLIGILPISDEKKGELRNRAAEAAEDSEKALGELLVEIRGIMDEETDKMLKSDPDTAKALAGMYQDAAKKLTQAEEDFDKTMAEVSTEADKVYKEASDKIEKINLDEARTELEQVS